MTAYLFTLCTGQAPHCSNSCANASTISCREAAMELGTSSRNNTFLSTIAPKNLRSSAGN